jgi:Zn-dependent M28 family amino/carboxypeptidase
MSTSNEAQWRKEAARRKQLFKLMLLIFLGFLLLLAVACFWVTQPLLSGSREVKSAAMVEPARLESHVRTLSETLSPRDEGHPENLDRVAAYIRREFEQAGAIVSEQPYEIAGRTYRNVIAQFGPETKERIVVGAHYDTAGPLPGADDNASGVAGLIEIAYLLGKALLPLRVELVAFTLEEPPFFRTAQMGSSLHAASLKKQGVEVRLMLSIEMIGYFSDAPGSQVFPTPILRAFYPSEGNFITVVGDVSQGLVVRRVKKAMREASPLPVYSINAPRSIPGIDFSDHLNYREAGYDALMVTDTAFYRNRNYHTILDTPDKLDYRRMAMVVEGIYAAIHKLSQP